MTKGPIVDTGSSCVDQEMTLRQAGHRMRQLGVTVLPVCGPDGSRHGSVSSEMIVRQIAAGGDPRTVTVGDLIPAVPGAAGWDVTAAGPAGWGAGSPVLALRALGQQACHAA